MASSRAYVVNNEALRAIDAAFTTTSKSSGDEDGAGRNSVPRLLTDTLSPTARRELEAARCAVDAARLDGQRLEQRRPGCGSRWP